MVQLRNSNGQFGGKSPEGNGNILPPSPRGNWDPNVQMYFARQLVENISTMRSELFRRTSDVRRSINDECGYPDILTLEHYSEMYDREAVARRVVEVLPRESWLIQPTVFEDEDIEVNTEFEKAWGELPKSLAVQSGVSWYKDEKGSPIWEYLRRIDELSGIGSYGVLLIGLDDGLELNEEAKPRDGQQITFIRAFDERLVTISQLDEDETSPRFGKPVSYDIQFSDLNEQNHSESSVSAFSFAEAKVHWTRVIHVADNLGSSEVFGTPRMQVPYNRLSDLRKLYGGSGEMYWKGAFPGLALTTHAQLGPEQFIPAEAISEIKDSMEKYMNSLSRYITAQGLNVESLSTQVVDPTPQIDAYIKAICILTGIPKRIFEGSERGELSSSQDTRSWNARLMNRQEVYLTPRVIVPFVDRLIWLRVLPEPENGYSVVWPDLESLTTEEKATVAQSRMDAASKYVQGGVESIMVPVDFFSKVLGFTDDEAIDLVEKAMSAIEGVDIPEPEEVPVTEGKDQIPATTDSR